MGSLILYISRGHTEATYSFVSQPTLHTCKGVSISKKFLEMQIIQIKIERAKRLVLESRDGYDIKCLLYIERQQYKHAINILSQPFYYVSSFLHKGESVTMFKRPCH